MNTKMKGVWSRRWWPVETPKPVPRARIRRRICLQCPSGVFYLVFWSNRSLWRMKRCFYKNLKAASVKDRQKRRETVGHFSHFKLLTVCEFIKSNAGLGLEILYNNSPMDRKCLFLTAYTSLQYVEEISIITRCNRRNWSTCTSRTVV